MAVPRIVGDRGKEGGAWANDDDWLFGLEGFFPELMAYGFSLGGVEQDYIFEVGAKVCDKLRGEGDFWN